MTHERLTTFTMSSFEKDVAEALDYGDIIGNFACSKVRKVSLK